MFNYVLAYKNQYFNRNIAYMFSKGSRILCHNIHGGTHVDFAKICKKHNFNNNCNVYCTFTLVTFVRVNKNGFIKFTIKTKK